MPRTALVPNAENCSLHDLEVAIKAAPTRQSFARMMAIKALLMGFPRPDVAKLHNVDERTIRRWIAAFNEQGVDGLIDRSHPGRPKVIQEEQAAYFMEVLNDPAKADQTHWTAVKFHGWIKENADLEIGYSTVVRWMHDQNFRLKVPQPWPDRQDQEKRSEFCRQLVEYLADEETDIWFCDETGVEGDPRPRRRWAEKGSKPRVTKNGDHLRMNVTGMVCPRTGETFTLIFSHNDLEVFQTFLNEANRATRPQRKRELLVLDNASWHKCKGIDWGRFEPVYLPPYSPDLNPIERLWLVIKQEWFRDFVAKDRDHLVERLSQALQWAMNRGPANIGTCSIRTKI